MNLTSLWVMMMVWRRRRRRRRRRRIARHPLRQSSWSLGDIGTGLGGQEVSNPGVLSDETMIELSKNLHEVLQ